MGGQHNDMPAFLRQVMVAGRSSWDKESRERYGRSCCVCCTLVLVFLLGNKLTRQLLLAERSSAVARKLIKRCRSERITTSPKALDCERRYRGCKRRNWTPVKRPCGWRRLGSTPSWAAAAAQCLRYEVASGCTWRSSIRLTKGPRSTSRHSLSGFWRGAHFSDPKVPWQTTSGT